ncbi:MAG: RNA methyltransferase tRNA(m5U54)methyltransferase [Stictis urceolatum]|nr:RNA methyltransferase tRNA(m5U54)methyltransferase [Stictis urceolata]
MAEAPTVEFEKRDYSVIKEGLAQILVPQPVDSSGGQQPQPVFYNPIQQFNRDLSVLAIRVFGEDFEVTRKLQEKKSSLGDDRGKKRKRSAQEHHQPRPLQGQQTPLDDLVERATAGKAVTNSGFNFSQEANEVRDDPEQPISAFGRPEGHHELTEVAPKEPRRQFTLKILDALSATGLRALRYAREIPQATMVTANDISPAATAAITRNVKHNLLTDQVFPTTSNASAHMYRIASEHVPLLTDGSRGKYHVVDLDPFGTAAPFVDAAVQATADGGLLCVTCTDAGVFASAGYLEKTFSQYGGLPLRGPHAHEGGLRLVLHAIATTAARYGIAIEPVLSLSIDFYVRVFVRIRRSPSEVKFLAGKTMAVYNCDSGCGAWTTQPIARTQGRENKNGDTIYKFSPGQAPTSDALCEHCGYKTHLAGPMWAGPIHNPFFIDRILELLPRLDPETYPTIPRIEGMLTMAREETLLAPELAEVTAKTGSDRSTAPNTDSASLSTSPIPRLPPSVLDPHPFFIMPSSLAKVLHCVSPSYANLRSALVGLGYRTTRSHTKAGSIRTDAPWKVIWEIMREWSRQHAPVKEGTYKVGTPGMGVMRWSREKGIGEVKSQLRGIADKAGDSESIAKGLEALLYRLRKGGENHIAREDTGGEPFSNDSKGSSTSAYTDGLSKLKIIFDEAKGREPEKKKLSRYPQNPRANWGPMNKAKGTGS